MTQHANRKARVRKEAQSSGTKFTEANRSDQSAKSVGRRGPEVVWSDDGEFPLAGGGQGNPGCDCGEEDAIVKIDGAYYCLGGLLDDSGALQKLALWREAADPGDDSEFCDECGATTRGFDGLSYTHEPNCSMYPGKCFFVNGVAVNAVVYFAETDEGERLMSPTTSRDAAELEARRGRERFVREGLRIHSRPGDRLLELVEDFGGICGFEEPSEYACEECGAEIERDEEGDYVHVVRSGGGRAIALRASCAPIDLDALTRHLVGEEHGMMAGTVYKDRDLVGFHIFDHKSRLMTHEHDDPRWLVES